MLQTKQNLRGIERDDYNEYNLFMKLPQYNAWFWKYSERETFSSIVKVLEHFQKLSKFFGNFQISKKKFFPHSRNFGKFPRWTFIRTPARRNIWSSTANYIPITYKLTTECQLVIGQFRCYAGPDIPSGGWTSIIYIWIHSFYSSC